MRKGFILIELIVCIAIVAILASTLLFVLKTEWTDKETVKSNEDKCYEVGGFFEMTAWGHKCLPPINK